MIEVKDFTSVTGFNNRLDRIHDTIVGSKAQAEEAAEKRSDIREVLGMKIVHEAILLWPKVKRTASNQALQPTALWRCASMSILISLFLVGAQPRSQSGG